MRVYKLKRVLSFILVLIIVFSNSTLEAEASEEINFRNITVEDGLTQATVEEIFQDEKGYIWIGTNDGLNKYNGNEFKAYRNIKGDDSTIINNFITEIAQDNEGNIWVGTVGGVSKLSEEGIVIKNYSSKEGKGNLSHNNIWEILVLDDGNILIGTDDGLNVYNKETDSFERILEGDKLTSQLIYSLDQDDYGDIWIGTNVGMNRIRVKEKKVDKLEGKGEIAEDGKNKVNKVYCEGDYVYMGTFNIGAYRYSVKEDKLESLYNNTIVGKGKPGENVKDFHRDSNGALWMATNNGLVKLDEEDGKLTLFKNRSYVSRSLANDYVCSIMEDRSGVIWVGTYSGISTFEINNNIKNYYHDPFDETTISNNMVHGIYEDESGYLWVGTNSGGVNILDKDKKRIETISTSNYEFMPSDRIFDITGYNENIFIGTSSGLVWINTEDKSVKIYSEHNGLVSLGVRRVFVDNKEQLWIGSKDGYNILDINSEKIININYILDNNNIKDKYSGAIFQDSKDNYYLGSFFEGGLLKLNPNTKEITTYTYDEEDDNTIIDNAIRVVTEDSKGNIWVGTSGGLCKIEGEKITRYTTENGLANNTIYGVLIDDEDNPWVSTNLGISKLNVSDNSVYNLNIMDGLQGSEFNGQSYLKTKDGEFLFGGINGMNSFYPNDIAIEEEVIEVIFDEFYVNGLAVDTIDNKKYGYEENNIRIKIFIPDYKNTKNTRFYYNMQNGDDGWNLMEGGEVLFSNLAPGDYNVRFVAVTNRGVSSDINEVNFKVKKIFWLRLPAMIIYILIIIALYIRHRSKMKILDRLVDRRTNELSIKLYENDVLYKKIIDLEKSKNKYFINLSHELRTPLNVISSTEQLITKLNDEGEIQKDKLSYYMDVVRRNNRRLLNLINNLIDISKMEHGKYIIQKKDVDIVYVVEEAALSLKEYVEGKEIELIVDPEIEEKIICCDPHDIERCIVNLISNAAKFTEKGGQIIIEIKEAHKGVKIVVKDTGIGISEESVDKIFDRFNQVIDEAAETKGGSGLGLTITRQIVDLHGGKIYVESEVGTGSSFIIELPEN